MDLALSLGARIVLAGQPLDLTTPSGIDETALNRGSANGGQIEDEIDETLFMGRSDDNEW